jgi:hypothetical protein
MFRGQDQIIHNFKAYNSRLKIQLEGFVNILTSPVQKYPVSLGFWLSSFVFDSKVCIANQFQKALLNVIPEHIHLAITITVYVYIVMFIKYIDNNIQLITLTVITLSSTHCRIVLANN